MYRLKVCLLYPDQTGTFIFYLLGIGYGDQQMGLGLGPGTFLTTFLFSGVLNYPTYPIPYCVCGYLYIC